MSAPKVFDAKTVMSLGLSAVMLIMGGILAMPWDTFATGKGWVIFEIWATEQEWAAIFIGTGLLGVSGSFPQCNFYYRIFTITVVATMHGIVSMLFTVGNPVGIGPVFGVWAIQGYYMVNRAYKWRS